MGLQNLTDMFSGSIIDYDTLLKNEQANRKQVGDAFAESMKALNNNYDIFNRKTKYNDVKNQLGMVEEYLKKEREAEALKEWLDENGQPKVIGEATEGTPAYTNPFNGIDPKNIKALDKETIKRLQTAVGTDADGVWGPKSTKALQAMVGANADGKWGPKSKASFDAWMQAHPDTEAVEGTGQTILNPSFGAIKKQRQYDDLKQYLDDNKEVYESLVRDYGWMLEDPSTTDMVAEEYIRTGDPTKFMQMKQNYRQAQLERERLANERAVKGANASKEAQEKSLKGRKLQARDSLIQATTMVANNAGIPTTVKDKLLDVIIYGVETEADEALLNKYGSKLSNQGLLFDGTGLMGYYGLAPEDISEIRIAEHELDKLGGKGEKGRTTPTKPKPNF